MAIEELEFSPEPDGRPSSVRITIELNMARRTWPFEEPARVAAGGTIEWVFVGLSPGDRPEIQLVGVDPLPEGAGQPVLLDPFFETLETSGGRIKGTIFREAQGRYRYIVEVDRAGDRITLLCNPAGMGGVDVSGPPVEP